MWFFKQKKTVTINTGGNPASRKLADATVAKLHEYGVRDVSKCAQIMGNMGKISAKYFRQFQPFAAKGQPFDHLLEEWTVAMKKALEDGGITDVAKQEAIILDYLEILEASC